MIKHAYLKTIKEKLRKDIKFIDNTKTELTEDEFFCILSWLNQFRTNDVDISLAYISKNKCLDFAFTKPVDDGKGLELYLIDRDISTKGKLNSDF